MTARVALSAILALLPSFAAEWTQFRGPNASGISGSSGVPAEFGPETNVIWRTALPPGNSSPALTEDRIYLTGYEGANLLTIALDRETGRILWRRPAPRPRQQVIERPANGPASASPATDGRNVYVFFQDFGLLAYGPDGNELWRKPLGPFNNPFGHGSSPIVAGNLVLMQCDADTDSFLLALDKNTGRQIWRTARPHAQRGYATPILYRTRQGAEQVVAAGSYRLSGYDLKTGKEMWWIRRLPWQIKPTPVIADHVLYFTTWAGESEPGEQENVPSFTDALAKLDDDGNGKLSKDEIEDPRAKARFEEYLDLDDTGFLEERDWNQFRDRRLGENALRAYRLGGEGDLTDSHLLWKQSKSLPNVPSPLIYDGVLYTLKEGGILTSYDPQTGAVRKQARITGALGDYYASPVAADGTLYTISESCGAAVIRAGAGWEVLRVNSLGEGCRATPAFAGGRMYIRTGTALFCFGKR